MPLTAASPILPLGGCAVATLITASQTVLITALIVRRLMVWGGATGRQAIYAAIEATR